MCSLFDLSIIRSKNFLVELQHFYDGHTLAKWEMYRQLNWTVVNDEDFAALASYSSSCIEVLLVTVLPTWAWELLN